MCKSVSAPSMKQDYSYSFTYSRTHCSSNELEFRVARSRFVYQLGNYTPIHPVVDITFALELPAPICSFTDDERTLSTPEHRDFVPLAQSPRPKPKLSRLCDEWLTVGDEAPDGFFQAGTCWPRRQRSTVEFEGTDMCTERENPASLLSRREELPAINVALIVVASMPFFRHHCDSARKCGSILCRCLKGVLGPTASIVSSTAPARRNVS